MNILSVDLEDWHHLGFAQNKTEKIRSNLSESLIANNTLILLRLFKMFNAKATFFILGETAEKYPDLIKEIQKDNYEIASHGYTHTPIFKLKPQSFEYEIRKSLEVLSKITGQEIMGYRAPHFSIKDNFWVFRILRKNGFLYDSSFKLIPTFLQFENRRSYYEIRLEDNEKILEFPVSVVNLMGYNIGFSGGTYFRMLPKAFIKKCIENINIKGRTVHIYLHPRDIEESLPKLKLSIPNYLRYSGHLGNTISKIEYLLRNFKFTSIKEYLEKQGKR